METTRSAVYEPPEENLPFLVVVFFPQQDVVLCRPAWSRSEADELERRIREEVGTDYGEGGTA